jgi:hypothetical protein
MILTGLGRIQTDPIDTRLINYLLEHSYRWLLQDPLHRSFWDPPFYAPARNVEAYSDTLLTVAPLYWVWRAIGLKPDTAFQLWMISGTVLNFVAANWLLRRVLKTGVAASAAGAFLFAFGASRLNEIQHQQLYIHVFTIVAIGALALAIAETERQGSRIRGGLLIGLSGLGIVAQLYASFYLGWFLILALGIATGLALLHPDRAVVVRAAWQNRWAILVTAGVAGILLYPMLSHYLRAARQVGVRSFYEVSLSLPDVSSWFYMGPQSWLYGGLPGYEWFRGFPIEPTHRIGVGFLTPAVCIWGLWRGRRHALVRVLSATGLVLVLMTTILPRRVIFAVALATMWICVAVLCRTQAGGLRVWVLGAATALLGIMLFPVSAALIALAWVLLAGVGLAYLGVPRNRIRLGLPVALVVFLDVITYPDVLVLASSAALALAVLAASRDRFADPPIWLASLGFAVCAVIFVYPDHLLVWWHVYQFVPGASSIRAVGRVTLLLLLPLSSGFALFVDGADSVRRAVLILGITVICVIEQGVTTQSYDKLAQRAVVSEIAARIDDSCETFYYSPWESLAYDQPAHLDAMWAGLERRKPTINGYSGCSPPDWANLIDANLGGGKFEPRVRAALRAWVDAHGIGASRVWWIKQTGNERLRASPLEPPGAGDEHE